MFFLALSPFFSKCIFSSLQHFFSPSAYPVNSVFLGKSVCIRLILFDEAFFILATIAMITKNVTYSSCYCNYFKGNKFFNHNHAAYQSKHIVKGFSKNCIKGVSPTPMVRIQTLTMESKCSKMYFLRFYYHLSYT